MKQTVLDSLSFTICANGLRLRRALQNMQQPVQRHSRTMDGDEPEKAYPFLLASSVTPLWTAQSDVEWLLTAGKVENVRLAAQYLHGLRLPPGEIFSFWRHVPRPIRRNGFVAGRELREGCLVTSIGGGLCQLSNALYDAALRAGAEVIERHRHSKIIAGSLAEQDRDATVFWNYVDLRFRFQQETVLTIDITATQLIVAFRGFAAVSSQSSLANRPAIPLAIGESHDCLTCHRIDCVHATSPQAKRGRTAWMLDDVWPEFDDWLDRHAIPGDVLHLPLDGHRHHRSRYAWNVPDAISPRDVVQHPLLAFRRSRKMRRVAMQGATRQRALLDFDRQLAHAYLRHLPIDVDRLVVSLNLLPHLWRTGMLGGRRFALLMTRMPLLHLQQQLDAAAEHHPMSPTLTDFRADPSLVRAEEAALRRAEMLITPHQHLALSLRRAYPGKVTSLDWKQPGTPSISRTKPGRQTAVLFPASALARKGAYELRAAAITLKLRLRVLGYAQETADFWSACDVSLVTPGDDPFAECSCVVLPAFVEHQPRLLLQAVARGIPVICTPECGLPAGPLVHLVPAGNATVLSDAIATLELSARRQVAE